MPVRTTYTIIPAAFLKAVHAGPAVAIRGAESEAGVLAGRVKLVVVVT